MLIKLQSPLIDKHGNQVYPLTTYDQIILPDNSRWDGSLLQGPAGPTGPVGPTGPAGNVSMTHISTTHALDPGPSAVFMRIKVAGAYVSPNDYFAVVSGGGVKQPIMATPWVSPEGHLGVVFSNFWQPESGSWTVTLHVGVGRYNGATFGAVTLEDYTE